MGAEALVNVADEGRMVAQWAYRPWGVSVVGMKVQVLVGES
jgi:hypothetical protein